MALSVLEDRMPKWFWVKRLAVSLILAGCVLAVVQHAKGHTWADAIRYGVLWGAVTAAVFTGVGYLRYRRNPACMIPSTSKESNGAT